MGEPKGANDWNGLTFGKSKGQAVVMQLAGIGMENALMTRHGEVMLNLE